jgi:hypothetical protein
MHLDVVLVDYLEPDGKLTTFTITPGEEHRRVAIERLRDIRPGTLPRAAVDLGGARIYDSPRSVITCHSAMLRLIEQHNADLSFRFSHLGIPVSPYSAHCLGAYDLLLAPGWRLTTLDIFEATPTGEVDPGHTKPLLHAATWDPECLTQLSSMTFGSEAGTFSFIVEGSAAPYDPDEPSQYLMAVEDAHSVARMPQKFRLDEDGRVVFSHKLCEIAEMADWLELKPGAFGIKINLTKMVKDCLVKLREKLAGTNQGRW